MVAQSKARAKLLAEMSTGIGASESHHLFSLEPFGCVRQLWYNKTKVPADHPFTGNKDTERGSQLEAIVRKIYVKQTGNKVKLSPMLRHSVHQNLICHPDGIISQVLGDGRSLPGPGLLEIKCPGVWNFKKVRDGGLGDSWIMQSQHGMLVAGLSWAHVVVFSAELWEMLPPIFVPMDEQIQAGIINAAASFRGMVTLKESPSRLLPDDPRCQRCPWRTTCQGEHLMVAVVAEESRQELTLLPRDDSLAPLVQEYCDARELEGQAKKLKDAAGEKLEKLIGHRPGIVNDVGRVYYKPRERKSLDAKALRQEMPDVAKKYERTSVVRSLKVFTNGPRE
jgi:predicted phage-related endonuclease